MKERGQRLKRNVHVWAIVCRCDDFIPYSIYLILQSIKVKRSFVLKYFFTHFNQLLLKGKPCEAQFMLHQWSLTGEIEELESSLQPVSENCRIS